MQKCSNDWIGGITLSKPENRADNKAHLQEHIDSTVANFYEAEDYLNEHVGEITAGKKQKIEAENDRREESIKGFEANLNHEARQ